MSDLEHFRNTVERFIAERGMNPTQFGKEFASDPRFVFQLRDGREPRESTRAKVLEAMTAPTSPKQERAAS